MNYGTGSEAYEIAKTKYTVYVHAKIHGLEPDGEGQPKWIEKDMDILRSVGCEGYLSVEYEGNEDEEAHSKE